MQVWELLSGRLLGTVSFPSGLTSITVDAAEMHMYAGTASGAVYKISLHNTVWGWEWRPAPVNLWRVSTAASLIMHHQPPDQRHAF